MNYAKQRLLDIAPFHVVELLTRARALEATGRDVIHMEVGEPDFPTPPQIVLAANKAIQQGRVNYTHSLGVPQLREAISNFYRQRYGVNVPASRIVITAGASGALTLACACLTAPGSRWLLTDPGYPCNRNFIRSFEGDPVAIPVGPETGFQPTAAQLRSLWDERTAGVLLASPSNPTGTIIAPSVLADIFRYVRSQDGTLIVDEIYQGLSYGSEATTALGLSADALENIWIVQSFSKYFQMTGWRLGWMVVPENHVRNIEKLAQSLFIAPSHPAQYGAIAAFEDGTLALLEERRQIFSRRRDTLLAGIIGLGFQVPAVPQGAFYVYADSSRLAANSFDFALRLLEATGVAITPGIDFGNVHPESFVRFAYTTSEDRIIEAIDRIAAFVKSG